MKKILSMFLVLCMVVTLLPMTAMAEEIHTPIGTSREITNFAPLTETEKAVATGISIEDLDLPETLTATVWTTVPIGEGSVQDSGSPETVPPTTATEPEWEETIVDIPVKWESTPEYAMDTEGEYVFTPVIEDYTVRAPLPEITVTVGEMLPTAAALGLVSPLVGDTYNIWVGGVQVTSDNLSGSGWIYQPSTSTLTLDGADITANYSNTNGTYGIYANQDLNIELVGDSTVTGESVSEKESTAIHVGGNLDIIGAGSLTAQGGNVGGMTNFGSFGIVSSNNLMINSGDVIAKGGNVPGNLSYGIYSNGIIKISDGMGGTITATGNDRAMNKASDLSDYNNVKISANSDDSEAGATVITSSELSTGIASYKYLKFEPAPASTDAAQIGSTSYPTLQAAMDNVVNNETIKLLDNITLTTGFSIENHNNSSFTLDLNGKTLSTNFGSALIHQGSGTLTIADSVGGGIVSGTANTATIFTFGTLTISGGTVSASYANAPAIMNLTNGTLNISGGAVRGIGGANGIQNNGTLNIYGGEISGAGVVGIDNFNLAGRTSILSGTSVIKGPYSAMYTAPDLSSYTNVKISASTADSLGNDATVITQEALVSGIGTYKYLKFEPATVPGAPTDVTATAGNGQANVRFTAPDSNGGAAITGYTVTSSPGGFTGTGTASPITVDGLTNGTSYTFTVTATNSVGTGGASAASNSITPSEPLHTYTISGKVVDGNDGLRILSGAKVELKDTSGTVIDYMNITLGDSYSFSNIPAGIYNIVASASGYVSGTVSGITVSNANVTGINFDLFPFYPVTDITMTNAASVQAGSDLTLTGIVSPTNATNQSIVWSIESANGTGATIAGSTFRATSAGTATVKATVANGTTAGSDYTKIFDITVTAAPVVPDELTGTATISNTAPRIGDRLAGSLVGGNNTGTLSYVWKAGGAEVGIGSEYIVVAAELGKVITLEITSNLQTGTVISAPTATVAKKAALSKPGAPTLASKTHSTVTLTANAAYAFSKDGTAWQTSNVFGGLTASTAYTFYQRVAETGDTESSAASAGLSVTTNSNSSGGGGSSSDNSSPVIVTPPAPDNPNSPTQGEIKVPSTADGKGNITVNITDKTVTDAFDKALADAKKNGNEKNGITVVLRVDTGSKTGSNVTVNLPKTVQDTIIEKKIVSTVVVVDKPDIRIGMDLVTVQEINKQAKSDVNITAIRGDSDRLTGDAKKAIGSRPVFDLKVNYGSDKQIQSFGTGSVSVTIPYTLGGNEKAENVQAVYVDANGKVHWLTNSVYDSVEQVLRFATSHFSTYGIGYKQTNTEFSDIAGHWAKEDIEFVVSRGLFGGTSTTTFSPNTAMTRGMFVTALGRLANADVTGYTKSSFADVKSDAYYMGYIEWASKISIVNGVDNNKFAPDQFITREQMAVIMKNYAKVVGFTLPKVHGENTFADSTKISDYAKNAVEQMQMASVISGKKVNLFDPQGTANRAEASAVLRRFVEMETSND